MKIIFNLSKEIFCKSNTQTRNKRQFITHPKMQNLNSDVVSFQGLSQDNKQLLEDIKKEYWEKLSNASSDQEKVFFLHSSTGLVPRSPWDSPKQSVYMQPVIHKFSFGEIVQILDEMKSNDARMAVLTHPEYIVKSEEDVFMSDGSNQYSSLTGSYKTSTKKRLLEFVGYNHYKESEEQQENDVKTLIGILISVIDDTAIPIENRKELLNLYKQILPIQYRQKFELENGNSVFTAEEMKYKKLFYNGDNIDWKILASSTHPDVIATLTDLKNDKTLPQKSRTKILTGDFSYNPFINRVLNASYAYTEGEKEQHIQVIKAMLDAAETEWNKHLLVMCKNSAGDRASTKTEDDEILAAILDSGLSFETTSLVLETRYNRLQKPKEFEKLYGNLSTLDAKLAMMAARYDRRMPSASIFPYNTKFCLEELNKLEADARENNDEESLYKIINTRKYLYSLWEYETKSGTYSAIKMLIENAPTQDDKDIVIEEIGRSPNKLNNDFLNPEKMILIFDNYYEKPTGDYQQLTTKEKRIYNTHSRLIDSFINVNEKIHGKNSETARDNIKQLKEYLGVK